MLGLILVHNTEGCDRRNHHRGRSLPRPRRPGLPRLQLDTNPSKRTAIRAAGYSYVYFCRMHYLFNVVTMEEGFPTEYWSDP